MSNSGRSTTGGPAVPYFVRSKHIEAAKHLRLTVSRYIVDRASLADVKEAMTMLVSVAPVSGEPGYRAGNNAVQELKRKESYVAQALTYRIARASEHEVVWTIVAGETIVASGSAPNEREATDRLADGLALWVRSQSYGVR